MAQRKNKGSDKLAYGITFFVIGILYLISKLRIIDHFDRFFDVGIILLIAGVIFLLKGASKTLGLVFVVAGLFLKSDLFFDWMRHYSNFIVPVALIIVGMFMIFSAKKK